MWQTDRRTDGCMEDRWYHCSRVSVKSDRQESSWSAAAAAAARHFVHIRKIVNTLSCRYRRHCRNLLSLGPFLGAIAVPSVTRCRCRRRRCRGQGRSDGGYIGIYTPQISLPYKFLCGYWLFFFLFDPGQIWYRASVRLSSCFFYLLTHHNLYPPPNEISGYAPAINTVRMLLIKLLLVC